MVIPFVGEALKALISPVTGLIKGWSDRKAVKLESETRITEARTEATIRRYESGDANAAVMDQLSAGNRGWKDDYLLILTTMPLMLLFVAPILETLFLASSYTAGSMSDAVMEGFLCLENTPEYYWYALGMIYIDTFGFRRMLRTAIEGWARSKFTGNVI